MMPTSMPQTCRSNWPARQQSSACTRKRPLDKPKQEQTVVIGRFRQFAYAVSSPSLTWGPNVSPVRVLGTKGHVSFGDLSLSAATGEHASVRSSDQDGAERSAHGHRHRRAAAKAYDHVRPLIAEAIADANWGRIAPTSTG